MPLDQPIAHEVRKPPLLSREEEEFLVKRWTERRDEGALHRLVEAHGRMVLKTARQFRAYGLPFTDLVQEGFIGVMQAAHRFDPEREVRFATYAKWWIRAAIQDYVLRNWSIVRLGTTAQQKSLFFNLRRAGARLGADGPLTEELRGLVAEALGVSRRAVEAMDARLAARDQSTSTPVAAESDLEFEDTIADEGPGPEALVETRHDGAVRGRWIAEALAELDARERLIIESRHLGDDKAVLSDLGRDLGISKERVRQLERRALDKMKAAILRQAGEDELLLAG